MPKGGVIIIILLMTWSFLVIILSNAYQGLIMSSVLVPKLTPVINSLEDLPMSSLNIIVYKGTSVETMIKATEERDNIFWQLKQRLSENRGIVTDSASEIRNLVASRDYVAIYCHSYFEALMEQDLLETGKCRFSLAKETFHNPAIIGIVMQKNSPLTNIFNRKVLQMLQGGLILHWYKQYHPKKLAESSCGNLNNGQNHPKVTLSVLQGAFLILAVGLGMATVSFLIEIVHHKLTTNGTHKK